MYWLDGKFAYRMNEYLQMREFSARRPVSVECEFGICTDIANSGCKGGTLVGIGNDWNTGDPMDVVFKIIGVKSYSSGSSTICYAGDYYFTGAQLTDAYHFPVCNAEVAQSNNKFGVPCVVTIKLVLSESTYTYGGALYYYHHIKYKILFDNSSIAGWQDIFEYAPVSYNKVDNFHRLFDRIRFYILGYVEYDSGYQFYVDLYKVTIH